MHLPPTRRKGSSPSYDQDADARPIDFKYSAFVSYSHALDGQLARYVRRGLYRLAKPFYRLPSLRVFLDEASLSADSSLWNSIESALANSEYFILMASPEAARSEWVSKEVEYWCREKPPQNILIALTEGEILWDGSSGEFDWGKTTALPKRLRGVFADEPRWVDLRWARSSRDTSLRHPKFRDCMADLAAPLHGRAKDELVGEEVRETRRARFLTGTAIAALVFLSLWLVYSRREANAERIRALENQSRFLASISQERTAAGFVDQGVLLALQALPKDMRDPERPYVPEAEAALFQALQTVSPRRIASLEGHEGEYGAPVYAEFSPDGSRIVTASEDKTSRVWDSTTGEQLAVLRGHKGFVLHATFSPDGARIVTASADRTARLWDSSTGATIKVFSGKAGTLRQVVFHPDGNRILTASSDAVATIWDVNTGAEVVSFQGHEQPVFCARFSPDGGRVLTAAADGTARLWETETGKQIAVIEGLPITLGRQRPGLLALFNPEGTLVATTGRDNALHFWRASDGAPVGTARGHSGPVRHATFSSDGSRLVTGSRDGTARLWNVDKRGSEIDVQPGIVIKPPERVGDPFNEVFTVRFSPDESFIVTLSPAGARLWDVNSGREIGFLGDEEKPENVFLSADARRMLTISQNATLWALAATSGPQLVEGGQVAPAGTLSPNGRIVVSVSRNGSIRLLDWASGVVVSRLEGHPYGISLAAFSPDGSRLVTTADDHIARIWDTSTGAKLAVLEGHSDAVTRALFDPTGDYLITTSEDRTARVWGVDGRPLAVLRGHTGPVYHAAFNEDAELVLTASDDGTARLWDVRSGSELSVLACGSPVSAAALSPSGRQALTAATEDKYSVRLWDANAARPLFRLTGFHGSVRHIAFNSDGSVAIAGSSDGTARLWSTSDGTLLTSVGERCFTAGRLSLVLAKLNQEERRIITVTRSGLINLWDATTGTRLTTFHNFSSTRDQDPCTFSFTSRGPRIYTVAASGDRGTIATLSWDGDLRLLRIFPSTHELISYAWSLVPRELTEQEKRKLLIESLDQAVEEGSDTPSDR